MRAWPSTQLANVLVPRRVLNCRRRRGFRQQCTTSGILANPTTAQFTLFLWPDQLDGNRQQVLSLVGEQLDDAVC